jgi:hypothetical protein
MPTSSVASLLLKVFEDKTANYDLKLKHGTEYYKPKKPGNAACGATF